MKRRRLTHTLFTFMAILGILGVMVSAFTWGGLEYCRHQKENAALRKNYIDLQKDKVKQKTIAALRYVMYKKNLAERKLKEDIKQRTYEAHATATHIYNENVKTKSKAESANQMIENKVKAETEKQQLEKQLEIAHKMEAIGLLAGGVAHDLNNTLSAIINVPEFILMKMKDDDPFKESIELILEAGKRASAIVHDLQTMNRGVVCENRVIDLNELIKNAVASVEFKDLREDFPEVELITQLADEQLLIDCSVPHINKLLLNLASNGMEAITNSGELSIVASSHALYTPIFGYSKIPAGDYALLEVKDNGSGIPPEDLQRIFEPFYSKKVLGRSGTGLGLAIVWSTVDNHHAFIQVESNESGTVFSIYFPKMEQIPPSQQKEVPTDLAKGKDQTILIVDDENIQHKTVTTMLKELGYKSESVFSGEEALEFLKNKKADVVLLDMMLGVGMNGCETYRAILRDNPE